MTILVQFMAVFGFFFVGLQYLQLILDYSSLKAALAMLPVAAVVLPTSEATPMLSRRFGFKTVMVVGLVLLGAGLLWFTTFNADSGYAPFLAGLLVAGVGIGLTSSTGTAAIVGSPRHDRQGVASAMNDTTREIGAAIGIAVMGSLYGSGYHEGRPALPSELPAEAAHAIRESAAGGLGASLRRVDRRFPR